jgi:hypothetical protein
MPKNKLPPPPPPVPATLTEQKSDFTAEGAPPPGRVATTVPATLHDEPKASTTPAKPKPKPRPKPAAQSRPGRSGQRPHTAKRASAARYP